MLTYRILVESASKGKRPNKLTVTEMVKILKQSIALSNPFHSSVHYYNFIYRFLSLKYPAFLCFFKYLLVTYSSPTSPSHTMSILSTFITPMSTAVMSLYFSTKMAAYISIVFLYMRKQSDLGLSWLSVLYIFLSFFICGEHIIVAYSKEGWTISSVSSRSCLST